MYSPLPSSASNLDHYKPAGQTPGMVARGVAERLMTANIESGLPRPSESMRNEIGRLVSTGRLVFGSRALQIALQFRIRHDN
jgi:hypothetical protein